jgi:hypothetical protein
MAHKSIRELTAELDRQLLSPADRLVPVKLEVRSHEGETLYVVGGLWDTIAQEYVDAPCEAHVVYLKKSQLEMGRAIGRYIEQRRAGDDARAALMMAIGNRGGGKTFICGGVLMVSLALAFPGRWMIGVSITAKQNRELKTAIDMCVPRRDPQNADAPGWITQDVTDPRDPHTLFITGSTVLWLTARNPKALRQALLPFEHVLVNEGQDQAEVVFTNAIHAVRSRRHGGRCDQPAAGRRRRLGRHPLSGPRGRQQRRPHVRPRQQGQRRRQPADAGQDQAAHGDGQPGRRRTPTPTE